MPDRESWDGTARGAYEAIRGVDTRWGEPGRCAYCGVWCSGPDACLGVIPGLVEACCGHGDLARTYATRPDGVHLHGASALPLLGRPSWPAIPPTMKETA